MTRPELAVPLQREPGYRLAKTLLARTREDYGLDLVELLPADYSPPAESDREEWRAEVNQLRDKIGKLGHVNVQAIDELEELDCGWRFRRSG